ncbi:MAG: hypothetical protein KF744_11015 [Taibaiella sp.]|nr:hypothetical protein [Taibaiella sp.]
MPMNISPVITESTGAEIAKWWGKTTGPGGDVMVNWYPSNSINEISEEGMQGSCADTTRGRKRAMQIRDMTQTGALIKELWTIKIKSDVKKVK